MKRLQPTSNVRGTSPASLGKSSTLKSSGQKGATCSDPRHTRRTLSSHTIGCVDWCFVLDNGTVVSLTVAAVHILNSLAISGYTCFGASNPSSGLA